MEQLIELLRERNNYLEKFHNINEKELVNLGEGRFENLEFFYGRREGILNILSQLDHMIGEVSRDKMEELTFEEKDKKEVLKAVEYKDVLVTEILSQDLQVLSLVESAKTEMIKDLVGLEVARQDMKSHLFGSQIKSFDEED